MVRAGIHAGRGQLLAQLDDEIDDFLRHGGRGRLRTPGAGFERRITFGAVAGQHLIEPGLGDAVGRGDFTHGSVLDHHSGDQQTGKCHGRRLDAGDRSVRDLWRHQSGVS